MHGSDLNNFTETRSLALKHMESVCLSVCALMYHSNVFSYGKAYLSGLAWWYQGEGLSLWPCMVVPGGRPISLALHGGTRGYEYPNKTILRKYANHKLVKHPLGHSGRCPKVLTCEIVKPHSTCLLSTHMMQWTQQLMTSSLTH